MKRGELLRDFLRPFFNLKWSKKKTLISWDRTVLIPKHINSKFGSADKKKSDAYEELIAYFGEKRLPAEMFLNMENHIVAIIVRRRLQNAWGLWYTLCGFFFLHIGIIYRKKNHLETLCIVDVKLFWIFFLKYMKVDLFLWFFLSANTDKKKNLRCWFWPTFTFKTPVHSLLGLSHR